MDEDLNFTEDEIQEQLEQLGYYNVPRDRLRDFKNDLEDLIKYERTRNGSWSTVESSIQSRETDSPYEIHQNGYHIPGHVNINSRSVIVSNCNPSSLHQQQQPSANLYRQNDHTNQHQYKQLDVRIPKASSHGPAVHIEKDTTGGNYSVSSDVDTQPKCLNASLDSTTSTERRTIKRKVLRKVDGQSRVFDESSVTESDFDDVEERLRALPLSGERQQRPTTAPSGERRRIAWSQAAEQQESRPKSAESEPCYRLPDDYLGAKALIRPMTTHPHVKNVKKHDPVSRYQQYRDNWTAQRAPGERKHSGLRWNVREQMLQHDQVVEKKTHKVFVPNSYKVPTEKKRKNLRWHIRTDLAQGVVPPSMFE